MNIFDCSHTVLELEVRLATEEEEKKLLQSRLEEVREQARQQQEQLRTELEKVRVLERQFDAYTCVDGQSCVFFYRCCHCFLVVDRQGKEKAR